MIVFACSFAFVHPTNVDQHNDITRAVRVMWNEAPNGCEFGHPNRIPPTDEQLRIKTLCKMGLRLFQRKIACTVNGRLPYKNHFEMFAKDVNWNGIMTRAGWTADNFHMLLPMVQLALRHQSALKIKGCNYFHRRTVQIKQWWQLHAQEILLQDPTFTGTALQLAAKLITTKLIRQLWNFERGQC